MKKILPNHRIFGVHTFWQCVAKIRFFLLKALIKLAKGKHLNYCKPYHQGISSDIPHLLFDKQLVSHLPFCRCTILEFHGMFHCIVEAEQIRARRMFNTWFRFDTDALTPGAGCSRPVQLGRWADESNLNSTPIHLMKN